MALLDDVSLKLLFIAENAAQDVLDGLMLSLKDLLAVLKDLQDADPFMTLQEGVDSLTESLVAANDQISTMTDTFKALGEAVPELEDVQMAALGVAETLQGPVQEALVGVGEMAQEATMQMTGDLGP